MPAALQVRPLAPALVEPAVLVLVSSHADYPAFRHVLPEPRRRARVLRLFHTASVTDAARLGGSTVTERIEHVPSGPLYLGMRREPVPH